MLQECACREKKYPSDEYISSDSEHTLPLRVIPNQSGLIDKTQHEDEVGKTGNVWFKSHENTTSTTIQDGGMDSIRYMNDTPAVDLSKMFSRPVKIREITWSVGAGVDQEFDPWSLFLGNVRNLNRITTFNLLKSKLCLSFQILGGSMYYGRAMASYCPYRSNTYDEMTTTSTFNDLVGASQRPKIFLDPAMSAGGDMCIPFHYFSNQAWVQNSGWSNLGRVWIRSINDLDHTNSGNEAITISVWAWAEDVDLSVLTTFDAGGLSPQTSERGKEPPTQPQTRKKILAGPPGSIFKDINRIDFSKLKDGDVKMPKSKHPPNQLLPDVVWSSHGQPVEDGTVRFLKNQSGIPPEEKEAARPGIISGPASKAANIANALTKVPVLSPYATGAENALKLVAGAAEVFGYSNLPRPLEPENYRPALGDSLANTDILSSATKLTFDSRQGLALGPKVSGYGEEDPLVISSIAERESFLTKFEWDVADISEGTTLDPDVGLLFNMRVDPCTWAQTGNAYHFPACAAAALPGEYWTGTYRVRFQIVASPLHRGMLKFVYDPNNIQSNEYNAMHTKVIDINKQRDFSMDVAVGRPNTFLRHAKPGYNLVTQMYSTTRLPYAADLGNGVIGVYVANKLSSPGLTGTKVEVNVYVSVVDFKIMSPDSHFQNFVIRNQSGNMTTESMGESNYPDAIEEDEPNAPEHTQSDNIGVSQSLDNNLMKMYGGEEMVSFRQLMKRDNKWLTIGANTTAPVKMDLLWNWFPPFRGNVPGAIHQTSSGNAYNFVNTIMLHYTSWMFSGMRGSIRYRVIPRLQTAYSDMAFSRHNAVSPTDFAFTATPWNSLSLNSESEIAQSTVYNDSDLYALQSGTTGLSVTTSLVNPVLHVEVPFYSAYRYYPGKTVDWNTPVADFLGYNILTVNQSMEANGNSGSGISAYDIFVSTGDDFDFYYFTGLPRLYFETFPPDPDS